MTDRERPAAYVSELEAALKEACAEWEAWMDGAAVGDIDPPNDDDWGALARIRGVLRTGMNV